MHVAVAVAPTTATITLGQTKTFTATVAGSTNQAVTWSVQEGSAGGAVDSGGNYTPPPSKGVLHVVATSNADPSQKAKAEVTVQAGTGDFTIR